MPVVDPQYRGEVRVELYSPPAFNQFPPSKILVPAFWAQRGIQQPLRAIRVRQGLRVLPLSLDDIAGQAETSGRAGGARRTSEKPTEVVSANTQHAERVSANSPHTEAVARANALATHACEAAVADAPHTDVLAAVAADAGGDAHHAGEVAGLGPHAGGAAGAETTAIR